MTTPVTVRPYRDDDATGTFETFRLAVHRTASSHYDEAQRAAWAPDDMDQQAWAERRAAARTWVAELDGAVVGFTDLDAAGYVDMLFVHPEAGRRGVGATLLETVLATAAAEGVAELSSNVSRTARPVFERAGFTVEAEQQVERHGVTLTNYRMVRRTGRRGTPTAAA